MSTKVQISNDIRFLDNNNSELFKLSATSGSNVLNLSNLISSSVAPTDTSHLVNKEYVDTQISNNIQGLDVKDSVRFASTANVNDLLNVSSNDSNLDLNSTQTLESGDRVLLKNQTTTSQNGIYVWNEDILTRSSDFDSTSDISKGAYAFVYDGSVNKGAAYAVTTLGTSVGFTLDASNGDGDIAWSVISNSTSGASNASNIITGTLDADRIQISSDDSIAAASDGIRVPDAGIFDKHIANSTITSSKLAGGITSSKLAAGSVTNEKLENTTVSFGGVDVALGGSSPTPAFDLTNATKYNASNLEGTITSDKLANNIPVSKLASSTVSFGGVDVTLGGTSSTPAFDLSAAYGYNASNFGLGEIASDKLANNIPVSKLASSTVSFGGVDVTLGGTSATPEFDLSAAFGYNASNFGLGEITSDKLASNIPVSKLASSTVSFGGVDVTLGGTSATPEFDLSAAFGYNASNLSGEITSDKLAALSVTNDKLNQITTAGKVANSATTATDAATTNAIVARDVYGGFSAVSISVSETITAQTVSTTSDPQLKKDMTVLNDCIQKIDMINGYSFTWKNNTHEPGMQYGLNADEVEEMNSDLIRIGTEGYKSVNYNGVLAVMLGAIKELKAEVEILKEKCSC